MYKLGDCKQIFGVINVDWTIILCRPKIGDSPLNIVNNNCEWTAFSLTTWWASYGVSKGPMLQPMDYLLLLL